MTYELPQFTKEECVDLFHSDVWKHMTDAERVEFQLFQKKLFMPMRDFEQAVRNSLNGDIGMMSLVYARDEVVEKWRSKFGGPRSMTSQELKDTYLDPERAHKHSWEL